MSLMAPKILKGIEDQLRLSFARIASPHLDQGSLNEVLGNTISAVVQLCLPVLFAVAVAGVAASALQNKPSLNMTRLKPDFKRLNPLPGLQALRLAALAVELVKSLVKLAVVGGIVFLDARTRTSRSCVQLGHGRADRDAEHRLLASPSSLVWRVLGTLLVLASPTSSGRATPSRRA